MPVIPRDGRDNSPSCSYPPKFERLSSVRATISTELQPLVMLPIVPHSGDIMRFIPDNRNVSDSRLFWGFFSKDLLRFALLVNGNLTSERLLVFQSKA